MDTGDAPAPARAAEGAAPPPAAEAAIIASAVTLGSEAATSFQSSSSAGSGNAKANDEAAMSTPKKTQRKAKRKGRPPKAKGAEALEWRDAMTASLMRLRGTGMQGDSLADNDNVGELFDSDGEDDNGNTGSRKRGKTVAEGLEVGMKAMSAGFHALATAISSQQPPRLSAQPQHMEQFMEARFNIVIEQLQVQNQNLRSLIELLRNE
ncbi:hypothetical protein PRNP1_002019 [Phytophthora ramorum]